MQMTTLTIITGNQLSPDLAALKAMECGKDHVLMAELCDEVHYVRHHVKKIVLVFSAMRHFAEELRAAGHRVHYHRFDPEASIRSFSDAVAAHCQRHAIDEIVVTRPGEWRVFDEFNKLEQSLGVPVRMLEDDRFVSTLGEFADWADGRKSLRMEFFYRLMRKRTGLLMDPRGEPEGGQWNFDADNRRKWKGSPESASPMSFVPDDITREVIELVSSSIEGFGELDGFDFGVTRAQARRALAHFVRTGLAWFGDYQDALPDDEDYLFHSRLSAYLNIGLLDPLEVCEAVEGAWRSGEVPLNAAAERTGDDACPFNALYWDFLMRNEKKLGGNPRMRMMYRNVERLEPAEKAAITRRANWIRENVGLL